MKGIGVHSILAVTAMGAALSGGEAYSRAPAMDERSEFAKASDELKQLSKPRTFYPCSCRPYVRPIPKLHKGKKAVRAAKRAANKARYQEA